MDGADAEMGHRGVRLEAGELGDVGLAALVGMDDGHHGRLADDDGLGPRHFAGHAGGQRMGAETADLLVVGEREMDRLLQVGLHELRQHGERDGVERLHVAGASAVVLAVLQGQRPRVGDPGLPVDRHDVGMAGQDHATLHVRADRREQIGLLAVRAGDEPAFDAEGGEMVPAEMDQLEIAALRFRIERNQLGQHLFRRHRHGSSPSERLGARPRGSSVHSAEPRHRQVPCRQARA